jgi:hypothetical protein
MPTAPSESIPRALQQQNNFGFSFAVPTEFVTLPSEGECYPQGNTLCGVKKVEIKQLTAREEDILSNEEYILEGVVFDKLLESILCDKGINPKDFVSGDRNAILTKTRSSGYGSDYEVTALCPKCTSATKFTFDLSDIRAKKMSLKDFDFEVTHDPDRKTYQLHLPKADIMVSFRLMTGQDEAFVKEARQKQEKLGLDNNWTINFLRRIICGVKFDLNRPDMSTDKELINKLIEVLPATDFRRIKSVYDKVMPDIETTQNVVCSSCSEKSDLEVPFTMGFFWPN